MRVVALLLVAALAASCSQDTPKAHSVRKYCVLSSLPRATADDLLALNHAAVKLFEERVPYRKTDPNKRVINAATGLASLSLVVARQLQRPELFVGQPKGLGIGNLVQELVDACAALPKGDT